MITSYKLWCPGCSEFYFPSSVAVRSLLATCTWKIFALWYIEYFQNICNGCTEEIFAPLKILIPRKYLLHFHQLYLENISTIYTLKIFHVVHQIFAQFIPWMYFSQLYQESIDFGNLEVYQMIMCFRSISNNYVFLRY